MTYADAETAKFCGNDTFVGKYTLGVELPADFTEEVPEELGNLSNIKFTFSSAVSDGNTMENSVGIELGNLGSLTFKSKVTAENSDAGLAIPSDVIDLGDMQEQPDDATMKKLEEYIMTASEKIAALADGPFGDILEESGILDGINMLSGPMGPTGGVPMNDILDLTQDIVDIKTEISSCRATYGANDAALENRANALIKDIDKLSGEIGAKLSDMSAEEFKSFTNRYNTLRAQADALKRDYEKMPPSSSTTNPNTPANPSSGSTAESLNYDGMSIDKLLEVLEEYDARYLSLFEDDAIYNKIVTDSSIESLYDECEAAYEKVESDFDLYTYNISNLQSLRNLRKSVKAYAVAVEKFEKAVQISI